MESALKRLGVLAIVVALVLSAAGGSLPGPVASSLERDPSLPKHIGVVGVIALTIGLVLGRANTRRCRRCSRLAEKGSIFCHQHHVELDHQASQAMRHRMSE